MTIGELKRALEHVPDDCPFLIMGTDVQHVFQFPDGVVSTEDYEGDDIVHKALTEGGRLLYTVYAHLLYECVAANPSHSLPFDFDDLDYLLEGAEGKGPTSLWPFIFMLPEEIAAFSQLNRQSLYLLEQHRLHPLPHDPERDPRLKSDTNELMDRPEKDEQTPTPTTQA